MQQILSVAEMGEADRRTIAGGYRGKNPTGLDLMEAAGRGVADEVAARHPLGRRVLVLAGPGNNGGDGFVAARILRQRGYPVTVALLGDADRLKGDARSAWDTMGLAAVPADPALVEAADIVIDALFGAGLDRPLDGDAARLVGAVNGAGGFVVSVDLPSGVSGDTGAIPGGGDPGEPEMGRAVRATVTVTFCRKKPGHLLYPGRGLCGPVRVIDIGIPDEIVDAIAPKTFVNEPGLWRAAWHPPVAEGHKYARGHAAVACGPSHATGAARLAAGAALRIGAGLVTVASPVDAVAVNAAHLSAVMIRPVEDARSFAAMLADRRLNAVLIGPGFGIGRKARDFVRAALAAPEAAERIVVLDADALTSFADAPGVLFDAIAASACRDVVMTPHDGEFSRLFPGFHGAGSRLERARAAAALAGASVVLKGADTVIAAPDGRAAINGNAPAWLATAGAGDVLAGIIAGLGAQGLSGFAAAAMGVWCHGEAGGLAGAGLIAEDLAPCLKPVIARLAAQGEGAPEGN